MFDPETYVPGDPWVSTDFYIRALSSPRISVEASSVGDVTPASYFEHRSAGRRRGVLLSAGVVSGTFSFSVAVQVSSDDGDSWVTIDALSETESAKKLDYEEPVMVRLFVSELGSDTVLSLRLHQAT